MSVTTPRRSLRIPHTHTPKMSERKKGLFLTEKELEKESLTRHRRLSVVNSESDSDDCALGIISALDSSSCDENDHNQPQTPEKIWRETRSHTKKFKENQDLQNFMKSPYTLTKYQKRCLDTKCTGSLSTPATPHFQNYPGTPSSSHSCASVHTTTSTSSKARKSLASIIADTESCSSSLKDLNFDSDSGADSKENTPTKSLRRSRRIGMTSKLSFKGILVEQKINKLASPMKMDTELAYPLKEPLASLTKININDVLSPTQMMKTPHNTTDNKASPPKICHRRSVMEVQESPESCEKEKSYKRVHYDGMTDGGLAAKYPRLDPSVAPKARQSLFNSDRLKEILSAKSFYGKSNPDLNTTISSKISKAIEATSIQRRRPFASQPHRHKRKPGQINMGVRHRIRKPKMQKNKFGPLKTKPNISQNELDISKVSSTSSIKDVSVLSQNSTLGHDDKTDPFDKEKQTIDALLSQWTEEEVPETELVFTKPQTELACFTKTVIEETNQIFEPVTAIPVALDSYKPNSESVFVELGNSSNDIPAVQTNEVIMLDSHSANHGSVPKNGEFLPVEGGYLVIDGNIVPDQKEIPDLDEIERELKMLDEQIMQMAQSNNMDAEAVLASTDTVPEVAAADAQPIHAETSTSNTTQDVQASKLFSIFSKPNPGLSTPSTKEGGASDKQKKLLLKTSSDQYVIDAGQKKFGATQCTECGVIYQVGDPEDEHDHLVHHNAVDVLRFNGLKEECVVDRRGEGRCLKVRGGGPGWKKVLALLERVVHPQLGYAAELPKEAHVYTAYLYIEKKQIVGCSVMEPKTRAHRMIPGEPSCCSVEDYPVKCGVSRIWTHARVRRQGVARALLDCARASLLYGAAMSREDVAFSAPTPAGAALATAYCATPNFYVYLD